MDWTDLLGQLDGQIKQKVAALEKLQARAATDCWLPWHAIMQAALTAVWCTLQAHVQRTGVSKEQVSSLLDVSGQLLCDNNFKV